MSTTRDATSNQEPPRDLTRRSASILVALLTLAALVQRFVGLGFMLPQQPEPDAVIVWQAAWFDRPADALPTDNVQLAPFYPFLLGRTLAALPGHSFRHVLPADRPLAEHLAAAAEPYLRGRMLIAILSVIAIPATYRLARAFLSRGWSLCAAAFFATSLLDLAYAQQARPHCASCSLSVLAVLGALRILRKPTLGAFLCTSIATFFALGALHNGVFVLPAVVLALWLAARSRRCGAGMAFVGLALVLASVVAAVLVFYPFLFQSGIVKSNEGGALDVGGQIVLWDYVSLQGFVRIARGMWSYDPVLVALGGAGWIGAIVVLVRGQASKARSAALVAGAFPVSFLALWGFLATVWPRFTIQLLPYLALGAALAARWALPRLVPRGLAPRARATSIVALALLLVAVPAAACIELVRLRAREDTQSTAARWLESHAERATDGIATTFLMTLPLFAERSAIEALPDWARGPWEQYQLALPAEASIPAWRLRPIFRRGFMADKRITADETLLVLDEDAPRWVAVVVPTSRRVERDDTRDAVHARLGEPVLSILPFDVTDSDLTSSGYELGYHAFERVLDSNAWGPPIEIYRVGQ